MFLTVPITFKWTTPEKVMYSTVEIKDGQLKLEGSPDVYPLIFMSPRGPTGSKFDAQRFSELSKQNKSGPALKAVQRIFPEVRDITLENLAGELVLHAYMERLTEKIPLVDLSSGVTKYLSIVLSVLTNKDGTVLIDEIENGFYYAIIPWVPHPSRAFHEGWVAALFAQRDLHAARPRNEIRPQHSFTRADSPRPAPLENEFCKNYSVTNTRQWLFRHIRP